MKGTARFTIAIGGAVGGVVVTVHGELDLPSAAQLQSVLTDLIASQEMVAIIVDLHDARPGDHDALSVFASAAELAESRGGTLVVSCASASMQAALAGAGLARLVTDGAGGIRPAVRSRQGWPGDHPAGGAQHWNPRVQGPGTPAD